MTAYTEREAKLVPTLLNVLIAGMCDPPRLNRGRSYARQGAVLDVHVSPGEVTGWVQGSRSVPYEVVAHVTDATDFSVITALVPTARQVRFDCSCPDWDSPCKHAVAVMYDFAERVGRDPVLLATWRGAPSPVGGTGPRAEIGSRSRHDAGPSPSTRAPVVVVDATIRAALDEYLGHDFAFVRPEISVLSPPRSDGWDDAWAAMLDSALTHLSDHVPRP